MCISVPCFARKKSILTFQAISRLVQQMLLHPNDLDHYKVKVPVYPLYVLQILLLFAMQSFSSYTEVILRMGKE